MRIDPSAAQTVDGHPDLRDECRPESRRLSFALRRNNWARAHRRNLAAAGDLGGDVVERGRRIGTDRADSRDTNNNDQSKHDRVLDSRRAVFGNHEFLDRDKEITHRI